MEKKAHAPLVTDMMNIKDMSRKFKEIKMKTLNRLGSSTRDNIEQIEERAGAPLSRNEQMNSASIVVGSFVEHQP